MKTISARTLNEMFVKKVESSPQSVLDMVNAFCFSRGHKEHFRRIERTGDTITFYGEVGHKSMQVADLLSDDGKVVTQMIDDLVH